MRRGVERRRTEERSERGRREERKEKERGWKNV